jgi:PadR family transcriptional regulator
MSFKQSDCDRIVITERSNHLQLFSYKCKMHIDAEYSSQWKCDIAKCSRCDMRVQKSASEKYNAENVAWSKNWLVPVLLLMLRQWSSYGYELMEKMSAFGLAAMNPGSFYRTLRQMEKDGMVSSNWDILEGGPARRVYSITDAGQAYLDHWVQSLDRYQRMMDTFFRMYTGQSTPGEIPKANHGQCRVEERNIWSVGN